MKISMKIRCERCKYWDHSPVPEENLGVCRLKAPVVIALPHKVSVDAVSEETSETRTSWPVTAVVDWCGEFRDENIQIDLEVPTNG